jgi:integrase
MGQIGHGAVRVDPSTEVLTGDVPGLDERLDRDASLLLCEARIDVATPSIGARQLRTIRPSDVKAWMPELQKKYAPSYVYAIHRRLSQVLADAVHDGILARNPCSRRTSPPAPRQRPYVATTSQVWALHDALQPGYRNVVLLGAFAGLRPGEMAALERADVDWDTGVITPERQHNGADLKTETSADPIPIPLELVQMLDRGAGVQTVVPGVFGRGVTAWHLNRVWTEVRGKVAGLPEGFRIQDLRHYFASLLISSGLDVKVVQARMRHASATITLNTYGHLWPDTDDTSRTAIASVLRARKSPPECGLGGLSRRFCGLGAD